MSRQPSAFRMDLYKFYGVRPGWGGPALSTKLRVWTMNFGLHCVACYRFGKYADRLWAKNKLLGVIPRCLHFFLSYFAQLVHHVNIDAATIGPGLYIGHVGTIYIGPTVIGKNFSLTHNVTIGIGHSEGGEGIPTIGDDCWIGTGSTIAGAITIGNRVTIVNGTVLSRSVPDGCLVGGNPGRIILRDYDNSKLVGLQANERAPE